MNTYTPDCWIIIRMHHNGESIDKVFGGWYGGFADGDSWKLSSGVTATEEFDDRYEFTNHSGSLYVCFKQRERMSGYMNSVYHSFEEQYADYVKEHPESQASMEVIVYNKN